MITFVSYIPFQLSAQIATLTDEAADQIIATRELETIARKEARLAKLDEATVLSEGHGILANGQTVIVREVEPPKAKKPSPLATTETVAATSKDQAAAVFRTHTDKEAQPVFLSATVYDGTLSRLSWRHADVHYVAYTNADFKLLRGVNSIETEAVDFLFLMNIGAAGLSDPYPNEALPDLDLFAANRSEYLLIQGDVSNELAVAGVEALLSYYDEHLPLLKVQLQRREALAAAKARYDANNPKEQEPFIMQFWIPENADELAR